jgi:hypothetical protein
VQFGKYAFQIDPNHARKIGGFFIEAAQAAEMDSFLYQFFTSRMDLPRENVGMLIAEFRHWRETHGAINAQPATGPKQ